MRKWIFASLIFFGAQVQAYSLRCQGIPDQNTQQTGRSSAGALQTFNMYDIESPARTSTVSGWQGVGAWQWGDHLVQWNYQNQQGAMVTVQFARVLLEELLERQMSSLEGDLFAYSVSPHGSGIRCQMLQ